MTIAIWYADFSVIKHIDWQTNAFFDFERQLRHWISFGKSSHREDNKTEKSMLTKIA